MNRLGACCDDYRIRVFPHNHLRSRLNTKADVGAAGKRLANDPFGVLQQVVFERKLIDIVKGAAKRFVLLEKNDLMPTSDSNLDGHHASRTSANDNNLLPFKRRANLPVAMASAKLRVHCARDMVPPAIGTRIAAQARPHRFRLTAV